MRARHLALSVALVASTAAAQQTTLFRNATLVDGTGAPAQQHVDLTIRDGVVVSVAPTGKARSHAPTKVVDCTGKFIIPGLISAHSHLGVLLNNATPSPDAYNRANVTASLDQFERFGVTTVTSLGLNTDLVYTLREEQHEGKLGGATLLTAGRGIGVPNGAPPFKTAPGQVDRPSTPEEARKDVDAYAAHHTDIVKVWVDNFYNKVPKMDPAIYAAAIDEAHKDHLPIAAHVYYIADAKKLVADGIDLLAHSVRDQPIDPALIAAMKQHGTWYIPTLALDEAFYLYAKDPALLKSPFFRAAAGPDLLATLEAPDYASKTLAAPLTPQHEKDEAMARANLKRVYDAGIPVALGTDSGATPGRIPGFSEHRELQDLVASGLTPLQAITLGTGTTGKFIHKLNPTLRVGELKPEYSADFIVLTANPLANIHNTEHIAAVYHHGRLIPNPPPAPAN
ncbi:MAG: amidohydrolase family protein [Acidobacteriaceae bacterium]|nr:amidohydrolase family protein [Acidobacteriaceae bacterium]